jgi:NAD(P)-dependent dehydrogenase (short-subunit alcohol dehydrogenase family)/acyl carrier protein
LTELAALGYPVRLSAWDPEPPREPAKAALTVPICGANYRKPAQSDQPVTPAKAPERIIAPIAATTEVPIMKPTENAGSLQQALKITQESLAAFQRLQEQTAQLHKQFLETQESAQRTLQTLVEGQQRIVAASLGMPMEAPPVEVPLEAPPAPTSAPSPPIEHLRARRSAAVLLGSTAGETAPPPSKVIEQVLIAIIAEKTGYPPEMLGLDMGLDADLGIDSIKRVEILSALQEKLPEAPVVKPEHLGTLHTLREIVEFLCQSAEAPNSSTISPAIERQRDGRAAPFSLQSIRGETDAECIQQMLIAIVAEKTGYPPEMLGLDMGLDADLGIDSIKRVEILSALQEKLPEAPVVKPEHLGTLHTLREIVAFLSQGESGALAPGELESPPAPNPSRAHAPSSPSESQLDRRILRVVELPLPGPRERRLPAGSSVWIVAESSPLVEGLHSQLVARGLTPNVLDWSAAPPAIPSDLGGLILVAPKNVAGIPRQALRWMQAAGPALRKAKGVLAVVTRLDGAFGLSEAGPHGDPTSGALAGLAKTASHEWPEVASKAIDLSEDAPVGALADELVHGGPIEVGITAAGRRTLEAVAAPLTADGGLPFGTSDVVVITGGARGVTAEVAVELARTGALIVLFGRSRAPAPERLDLADCGDDVALKRKLATNGRTPMQLDAEVKSILAGREVRRTMDRIEAYGGRALYRSVDVRDGSAMRTAIEEVRHSIGPVAALIHGAGVLADHRIEDLRPEQFDSVYETKVDGLQHVLAAIGDDRLKAIVLFSSSTGRFGRTGQAAYAAANEALNKIAQRESRRRPDCRVVAFNWGPWDGGMVTPALAKLFAAEGIGLIPLAGGARHLVAELTGADRAVEVVVLGARTQVVRDSQPLPRLGLVFERELDLDRAPVLRAHVIDGRAVLPLALTLEWLAHAALHGSPGLVLYGCDQLRVFHPVTVREGKSTLIQVLAGKPAIRDGLHRVPVELRGRRSESGDVVHSRAEMLLAADWPRGSARIGEMRLPPFPLDPDDVYQRVLFHGPELRGVEQIVSCGPDGIIVKAQSAPAPTMWLDQPLRGQWLTDPLVLDCAFQAMSVWCHAERGAVSLPSALGAYRQFRRFPHGSVTVVCRVSRSHSQIIAAEIEFRDEAGNLIARIDDFECVLDPSLNSAFRRNRLEPAGV